MLDDLRQILRQYWGYDSFRPLQEEIIRSVLRGSDTLALLPPAAGKSLCYQVPALAQDGLCLVISPLIALMKDQVEQLRRKHITALSVSSGMGRRDLIMTLELAARSNCKFLYVSPERLESELFRNYLPALDIRLIAVDEAHCISQWGYDFRPSYLRIPVFREQLPTVPVLALTASATPQVQEDIIRNLLFQEPAIFRMPLSRPNLRFQVVRAKDKAASIRESLSATKDSALIYCRSRKRAEQMSAILQGAGLSASFYHAGLDRPRRMEVQEGWLSNQIQTLACTNAFGLGIDKGNVGLVIHADVPDCLENYYQESGRAGRDGRSARALLLFDDWELDQLAQSASGRFPPLESVRQVYLALMNYLQIPAGAGAGRYFDFDLADFLDKFRIDARLLSNCWKTLEQEEILSYLDWIHLPSRVMFSTSHEALREWQKGNEAEAELADHLLRTYPGIMDQPVTIAEKKIARALRESSDSVSQQLRRLQSLGLLHYQQAKDSPQLFLMQDRVRESDLRINVMNYEKRKVQYQQRADIMIRYARLEGTCRSRFIAQYFGQDMDRSCGICDNCVAEEAVVPDR